MLNHRVRSLRPSATLHINERSNELIAQGRRVFKLGLGQSPFPVPPLLEAALRENAHQKDYLPVRGLRPLRDEIGRYFAHTVGIPDGRTGDDVIIGPGSKELLFLLQLSFYGDLLLPNPSWVSYAPQAHLVDRNVQWLPTYAQDNWVLQPQVLDQHCSSAEGRNVPRILLLNSPSNPTGCSMTADQLRGVAEVARKHAILVLSDEIYAETDHALGRLSIAHYYPEGTIISHGISKAFGAGGWRLGAHVFPPGLRPLLNAMAVVASETYTSVSAPIQHASLGAYRNADDLQPYLEGSKRVLRLVGRWCASKLREAGAQVCEPAGGFYIFPDFSAWAGRVRARGASERLTSADFVELALLETGVAFLPGSDFGRPAHELTARLAFVDFDGARALDAVQHLPTGASVAQEEAFVAAVAPNVVEGIQRLTAWGSGA